MIASALAAPPCFAWSDSDRGLSFVAWGAAALLAHGSAVDERWLEPAPMGAASLPLAVGGQSFAPDAAGDPSDCWWGWPRRMLFVPQFLLYRYESGRSGLIVRSSNSRVPFAPTRPSTPPSSGRHAVAWRDEPHRSRYEGLVQRAVNDISQGELRKVVVARRVAADGAFDPVASVHALRNQDGTSFALSFDGRSVFMGATPETLVAVADGEFTTHAVAGTSDRALDPDGRSLASSAKDRHEHDLVVDGIEQSLAPICVKVSRGEPTVAHAGPVQHLVTPIRATLNPGVAILEAVERLHPTPALCGAPRSTAARWIADHEPDRGWYGAPIGWLSRSGDGVFVVAIRSALLSPERAVAFAGAGIVESSTPAAEWRETEAKLRTATGALARVQ